MPGYDALNDLLGVVDPAAFARALNAWMQAAEGSLPRTLALDGKDIGGGKLGAIVTLAHHRDGTPAALIAASGAKADSELPAAQRLPIATSARVGGGDRAVEAMEGFGVLRAAALAGVPAVELRAISNVVEEQDRAKWDFAAGLLAIAAAGRSVLAGL